MSPKSILFNKSNCFLQQEVIGGADKYIAVCRRCHLTSTDSIKSNNRDASAQTTKFDIRSNNIIRNIRLSPTKKFVNAN